MALRLRSITVSLPFGLDHLRKAVKEADAAGVPVPLPERRVDHMAKLTLPPVGKAVIKPA